MKVYRLDVSVTMGYKQACGLRKFLKESYGAEAVITEIVKKDVKEARKQPRKVE